MWSPELLLTGDQYFLITPEIRNLRESMPVHLSLYPETIPKYKFFNYASSWQLQTLILAKLASVQ